MPTQLILTQHFKLAFNSTNSKVQSPLTTHLHRHTHKQTTPCAMPSHGNTAEHAAAVPPQESTAGFAANAHNVFLSFQSQDEHIWLFGYGSLVHKAGFEHGKVLDGYIKGWRRVWYQGSTDHRGTPEAPGRVVTLERASEDTVTWGRAYQLVGTETHQLEVLQYLEWREKQYDLRERVDVYCHGDPPEQPTLQGALVYIASDDRATNVNYAGPASLEEIADIVATAEGPSGKNDEYVYKLADAMRQMGADDDELFHLERLVRQKTQTALTTSLPR